MYGSADFQIRWEWEPGQMVRTPEHHATWARIELLVGDDCLTLVEDRDSRSSRRSIFAPLYPLAEWIAYNWWFLVAHSRPASGRTDHRHSVRSAGDGFVWPRLEILPEGHATKLRWTRDRNFDEFSPIKYLTEGEATVDNDSVWQTLRHVVISVLNRLKERNVTGTPLEKEWLSLDELSSEERDYCIAAAQLGLDPFAEADGYETAILGAAEKLSEELLPDFFDAVHVDRIVPAVDWITNATAKASGSTTERLEFIRTARDALRSQCVVDETIPYLVGWQQARVVRDALGLAPDDRLAIDQYVSRQSLPGVDPSLQAVGVANTDAVPTVVLGRPTNESGSRFILGRALWRRLATDQHSFLITTAYASRQKIERAFAAELLAPAVGIEVVLEIPPDETVPEDLGDVAEHFGVSTILVDHQIVNQLIANRG